MRSKSRRHESSLVLAPSRIRFQPLPIRGPEMAGKKKALESRALFVMALRRTCVPEEENHYLRWLSQDCETAEWEPAGQRV
jgi:hypothetical protein